MGRGEGGERRGEEGGRSGVRKEDTSGLLFGTVPASGQCQSRPWQRKVRRTEMFPVDLLSL